MSAALAPRPGDTRPAERALAAQVSEARLRKTVRDLVALGPRMGGTPSGDAAAAYVARAFRAYGLASVTFDDPPVEAYWADTWDVRIGSNARRLESAWPYRRSPSATVRSAPLVLLTASASSALAHPDGHIVYSPRFSNSGYAALVRSAGSVKAVLTSAPHEAGKYLNWAAIGELAAEPEPSIPVFALSLSEGRLAEAAASKRLPASVHLSSHVRHAPPKTVMATLGGPAAPYYLITAHGDSDSGGPGADDNASGVAVVLELARVLSAGKAGSSVPLPFTLRFVVFGQEFHSPKATTCRGIASC
jgi:aminopeptidase YwaD